VREAQKAVEGGIDRNEPGEKTQHVTKKEFKLRKMIQEMGLKM